jgi:phage shock protein C
MDRNLYRSNDDRIIAGVCSGLADRFGVDPTVIRLIWVFLLLPGGAPGLLPYLALWAIMPDELGDRASLPLVLLFVLLGIFACFVFLVFLAVVIPFIFAIGAVLFSIVGGVIAL